MEPGPAGPRPAGADGNDGAVGPQGPGPAGPEEMMEP